MTPEETLPETLKAVISRYAPELTVLVKTPASRCRARGCRATADMQPKDGKPAYYVCTGGSCACRWIWDKMDCRVFRFAAVRR